MALASQLGLIREDGEKICKQTNYHTIVDILLTNGLLICLLTCFLPIRSTEQAIIDQ